MKKKLLPLLALAFCTASSWALDQVNGVYQIGTAQDLVAFAALVNGGGDNMSANAVLTDDIDMTGVSSWEPIGNWVSNCAYKGHFDGQGHKIENVNITSFSRSYHGLFGIISTGCLIENFSIYGKMTFGVRYAGTIASYARDNTPTISNVHSYVDITNDYVANANSRQGGILGTAQAGTTVVERCTYSGNFSVSDPADNANYGGIVGFVNSNANAICNINDCLFDGTLKNTAETPGKCSFGGIVGYCSSGKTTITNCLSVGTVSAKAGRFGQLFGIANSSSSSTIIYNSYYVGANANGTDSKTPTPNEVTLVTTEQLASGEVAYMLNESTNGGTSWRQTLSADAKPTLDSTHGLVYLTGTQCPDGTPHDDVEYSNTEGTILEAHDYVDGICSYCSTLNPLYLTPNEEGTFEIGTPAQLKWFAAYVNQVNPAVNAILTANIDLGGVTWTPIGNASTKYTGIFDGQGHAITNFSYTATANYNGLFGYITDNAEVKNFSISGTLTSTFDKNGVVGASGGSSVVSGIHSSLTINVSNFKAHTGGIVGGHDTNCHPIVEKCEYSGTMTHSGTGDNQAGIIGYTYLGTIRNCIFSGTIIGEGSKYGGIVGYARVESFGGIYNCLSIGKIVANSGNTAAAAIIGNWNGPATENVKNNYYLLEEGSTTTIAVGNNASNITHAPVKVTADQLASGYVTAKLGYAFHQNLGSDDRPTLDKTKGYVTEIKDAGWSTQYITDSDVTIPTGIEVFAGVLNGSYITLEPITDKIQAEEPVILSGAAGFYNFMPTTGATKADENDLTGSDGTVSGGEGIYALAKKNDVVGFYPVSSSITIPEGRAYLNTNTNPVKGFFGFEEDDATAIEAIDNEQSTDNVIYNVAGQRLQKMQNGRSTAVKGIYIVNGKKVLF